MDVLLLSRIQFGITSTYHFLFAPLTMGLVILVAIMETFYAWKRNEIHRKMADFWGVLLTINYTLGVITGLTLEFQFGTNWSKFSDFVGDIFGSPLAIEGLFAFFLESSFIGLWFFGRDRISPRVRAFAMWMVALGSNVSALWIITASGFMQHPVGYVLRKGRLEINNFLELITNPTAWYMFTHTLIASYTVGAFFVMSISAYHLIRNHQSEFFRQSFRYGLFFALFSTFTVIAIGHFHGVNTVATQPAKAAAMEALWESGEDLPFPLFVIPNPQAEENLVETLNIPYLGSLLYTNNIHGSAKGLKDIPKKNWPNVSIVFWSFRLMVGLGFLMLALSGFSFYLYRKKRLFTNKKFLKVLLFFLPFPYIAINLGWIVTEMGRQPWVVYGLMKTDKGVSPISFGQILFSIVGLITFYTILIVVDVYLIQKYAKKDPIEEGSS